ncbi:hypothetical protein GLAREA_03962 [Glarea lozoyensis ATCC 20868]|uniref:BTB domain-containing protein n=1 Tax=Glarea lozoyensis (strain ATCC 20868 / MF5171) TaxID=1116229 RepID=S3CZF4_GLAL2|nr:uncharacterized protein GLAREA_03962 [Glarea lozoyensis ATCC 20868]EPE30995.1 hypothetical protein GLAREA_03962 [Glarea lozoyensis ATCC 20868]
MPILAHNRGLWASRNSKLDIESRGKDDGLSWVELPLKAVSPRYSPPQVLNPSQPVRITVGSDQTQKDFLVPKDALCIASKYFARLSTIGSDLYLPEDDPSIFAMFAKWIIDQEKPATYDPTQTIASEPWTSKAACAWVLGLKLQAAEFQRFALSKFIQTCALAIEGPWAYVERHAPVGSPLRLFSDHWVAWNCSFAGRGNNEYSALEASKKAHLVTKDTRDPRTFDIQHWYMSCSTQLDPNCEHDPLTQLLNDEKARNKAASSVKLPETGRLLENSRQAARLPQRAAPARYVPLNATPTAPPAQYGYRTNNQHFSARSEATFCGILWQAILCIIYVILIALTLWRITFIIFFGYGIDMQIQVLYFTLATASVGALSIFYAPLMPLYLLCAIPDGIALAYFTSRAESLSIEALRLIIFVFLGIPSGWCYLVMAPKLYKLIRNN